MFNVVPLEYYGIELTVTRGNIDPKLLVHKNGNFELPTEAKFV